MGSHGGGTAEGQSRRARIVRHHRGVLRLPDPRQHGNRRRLPDRRGFPVHFDRHAPVEADHVVVCGRIKPHTDFVGDIESGLMKMMLIGLGKHEGAKGLSPRDSGLQLRPDRPQRGRPRAGKVPHRRRGGDCRKRLRRNGADRSRSRRSNSSSAKKNCWCWPKSGCRGLPFPQRRHSDHRRNRQKHQRRRHGHQRRRPQT